MSESDATAETGWGDDDLLYLIGGVMSAAVAVLFLFFAWFFAPLFGFAAAFFGYQLHAREGRTRAGGAIVAAGLLATLLAVFNPVL